MLARRSLERYKKVWLKARRISLADGPSHSASRSFCSLIAVDFSCAGDSGGLAVSSCGFLPETAATSSWADKLAAAGGLGGAFG